jgi:hypothetical protein
MAAKFYSALTFWYDSRSHHAAIRQMRMQSQLWDSDIETNIFGLWELGREVGREKSDGEPIRHHHEGARSGP